MHHTLVSRTISATMLAVLLALSPLAQAGSDDRQGKRRGPPPQAFEACQEQAAGAVCSFEGHRGELQGTCIVPPRDAQSEVLVCAPEGGRHQREKEQDQAH